MGNTGVKKNYVAPKNRWDTPMVLKTPPWGVVIIRIISTCSNRTNILRGHEKVEYPIWGSPH